MTLFEHPQPGPPWASPNGTSPGTSRRAEPIPSPLDVPPGALPAPSSAELLAGGEMQAYLARLESERKRIGRRNRYLAAVLCGAVAVVAVVLWAVYRATLGAYAVLEEVRVEQHPIHQGRLDIAFRVASPGKVHCRRVSGEIETDLVDYFPAPTEIERPWSWVYEPGEDIRLTLRYRSGLWRRTFERTFPTSRRADIVVLIDATGSMSPSIDELREKCVVLAERLARQSLQPRFALLGFGDTSDGEWLDNRGFTSDVREFQTWAGRLKRFDGGDLPESALDALQAALELPLDPAAIRRFYLVTDAAYHQPSASGATAAELASRLVEQRVALYVFSRASLEEIYRVLVGSSGRFREIENFGQALSEGRILED